MFEGILWTIVSSDPRTSFMMKEVTNSYDTMLRIVEENRMNFMYVTVFSDEHDGPFMKFRDGKQII